MNIWEGIYKSFSEAPKRGSGFSGSLWLERNLKKIREINTYISPANMLPALVAAVLSQNNKANVLDFGGGAGQDFIFIKNSLNPSLSKKLSYHIIENPKLAKAALKLFKKEDRITFHDSLPKNGLKFDIVHFGSSLHYIEDWKGLLKDIKKFDPTFMLFTDLTAGKIPTYHTLASKIITIPRYQFGSLTSMRY